MRFKGEQIKIEKYRSGLQTNIRKMVRTSPQGTHWNNLEALIECYSLQWPTVAARIAKRVKSFASEKVGGKRKSSGGGLIGPKVQGPFQVPLARSCLTSRGLII
jgi:hypothetical protein